MRWRTWLGLGAAGLLLAFAASSPWWAAGAPPAALRAGLPEPQPSSTATATASPAPPAPPAGEPYFPFLAGESATESVSVGCTSHGHVVNARQLTDDEACVLLPSHQDRDLAYGTAEMIGLIRFAARRLHAQTGTRLFVGNIGKQGGGDVVYSVSHNAGRDADLAFCYRDRLGKPVDPPTLVPLNSEGLSKRGPYRFDAPRTWIVVRALLEYPGAQVQFLFIANSLKRQLLAHAAQVAAPAEIRRRAAVVLRQPSGGAAHNDHMHVRIYCGQRDVEGGCHNTGGVHPWAKLFERAKARRIDEVLRHLDDPQAEQRKRALERLVLLDARDHLDPLVARLADTHQAVRSAAATALGALGKREIVPELIRAYAAEPDFGVRVALLGALRDLGGTDSASFLRQLIAGDDTDWARQGQRLGAWAAVADYRLRPAAALLPALTLVYAARRAAHPPALPVDWQPADGRPADPASAELALRILAIDAAGRSERLEPIDVLIPLLASPSPALRARSAAALRLITNRSFGTRWHDPKVGKAWHQRQMRAWQHWIDAHRGQPRDVWLAAGFISAGYRVQRIHQKHFWELVRAVGGAHDHLSFNAQRALMRLTKHEPPSLDWSRPEACRYWLRWLKSRRKQFRLERPPKKLERRCS